MSHRSSRCGPQLAARDAQLRAFLWALAMAGSTALLAPYLDTRQPSGLYVAFPPSCGKARPLHAVLL